MKKGDIKKHKVPVCVYIYIYKDIKSVYACIYMHTHTLKWNRANKVGRAKNH